MKKMMKGIGVALALAALPAAAKTTFETVDLAPLKAAGAFGDAVWKDALNTKSDWTFFGVPFKLMAPECTADPSFALDLKPDTYAEAAVLFCIDEVNAQALRFATLRFMAGGVCGEVPIDLRAGEGPTCAPEIGRILRGPSGTLHFPVRFARIPLHPAPVAAAAKGGSMTLEFLAPCEKKSAFTIAALTLVKRPPLQENDKGFTLSFTYDTGAKPVEETLYEAEGALKIVVRDAKAHPTSDGYDDNGGNYYSFKMPDGTCPVIEAQMPGATGRIGIPFGALKTPLGKHKVRVMFNGVYFTIDVDERRDQDFPIAPLLWPKDDPGEVVSGRVSGFAFEPSAPKGALPAQALQKGFPGMYWNPADHNRWLGDVVTTTWDGKLHVFYLADRRHHNSKGGRGGHWFEHIVTADLTHWDELPAAVTMDESWEYIGTGTPFRMGSKYCLAYGLHTGRHHIPGFPEGGSYVTSDDGIHFTKTHKIITDDQNPSVYNRPDGTFGMGCRTSLQQAASVEGPWKVVVSNAYVQGDCPCPFAWKGWHYIIQGFYYMARSKTGANGTYEDEVAAGYDVYEGLSVPMVAPWKDDRRLLIGWINHGYGWGGWLCVRELIQYPDGHLGTKWVKEMPMPTPVKTYAVKPGEKLTLAFTGGAKDFGFVLDPAKGKAWYVAKAADGTYPGVMTLSEQSRAGTIRKRRNHPEVAEDFAIGKIRGLDKPFEVKLENHYDAKSDFTLVDIEIAGQRTMVTRRRGRYSVSRK